MAELAAAQLAVMNSRAHGDPHRAEIAEERATGCMQQLLKAALALDRVLEERGDEDGRRRLVESALRLVAAVSTAVDDGGSVRPCQDRSNGT